MKTLSIQIQPGRLGLQNVDDLVEELRRKAIKYGATASISAGVDSVSYVNINLETRSISELWETLKSEFAGNLELAHSAIVCCEGKNSWDVTCCCTISIRHLCWIHCD
jgi:hypothetical protein